MPLAAAALEILLPNGTDRWVGLLSEAPDVVAGTYVEITDSEYVRVAHDAWLTEETKGLARRSNNGAIVFPGVVDADITVVSHWGIFDADVAGNLLIAGPTLNMFGEAEPQSIPTNDVPRFNSGDLALYSEAPAP